MRKFILAIVASMFAVSANAAVIKPDLKRTVYITGVIGGGMAIEVAQKIESLTAAAAPITLIINSPGGSIIAGLQIISAIRVAKARGNEIQCVVPVMAASMGFQIFINCDKRYTLTEALLLFHPATSGIANGNKEEMLYASERLKAIEEPLIKHLFRVLQMPKDIFIYHYKNQTMWIAPELKELCPHLFTIVDDVVVPDLFKIQ